jgi:hypothetical protein
LRYEDREASQLRHSMERLQFPKFNAKFQDADPQFDPMIVTGAFCDTQPPLGGRTVWILLPHPFSQQPYIDN